MDVDGLALTGTCGLSTVGRRSGRTSRVEIWYVVVDDQLVVTGTPGPRHWLANLRQHPQAVLHLPRPVGDLPVVSREVNDLLTRRRIVCQAWMAQPWYADQPYSLDEWVAHSPVVILTPTTTA